ncbi:MAG: hypothetical protein LJE97_12220 [Betaproteobacteria bacterium]|nr:hypothetical protein [Betaproteobacteria bacterium]
MRMDLKRLYLPLAIAVILVGIGVAAVIVAKQYLDQTRVQYKIAVADRQAIQTKLSRATEEEREIREKLVDYRRLLARGVIGDERRLEWVETIGQIKNEHKLFEIKYRIDPQRKLDLPGVTSSSEVEFRVSALKVEMQLLHEGDLLAFLDGLRSKLKAHVLVRSCSIERVNRSGQDRGISPRLRANCVIDLVTIRDRQLKSS